MLVCKTVPAAAPLPVWARAQEERPSNGAEVTATQWTSLLPRFRNHCSASALDKPALLTPPAQRGGGWEAAPGAPGPGPGTFPRLWSSTQSRAWTRGNLAGSSGASVLWT